MTDPVAPSTRLSVNINEDCAAHLNAMKEAGVSLTETVRRAIAVHKFMHDGGLAEVWDKGYTSGHSNAMRRMSDEPNAPTTPNPYRETYGGTAETCGVLHSHVIPCQVAHPTRVLPPAECGDYPAPCNHDPAHVLPPEGAPA